MSRYKVRAIVACGILLFVAGLMLQKQWDRECGGRWDADMWMCVDQGS